MSRASWKLSRRSVLRGAAGATVALPWLEVMGTSCGDEPVGVEPPKLTKVSSGGQAAVEDVVSPRRLAYLYIPNGVPPESWQPQSSDARGRLLKLNQWMQDLEPHRSSLTLFRDLWTPRGNGHIAGTATWLTGGGFDGQHLDVGGASVDQLAASHFRPVTPLSSLELSSRGEGFFSSNLPRNSISWKDRRTPVSRETEPRAIYDRMFRGASAPFSDAGVMDLVLEDARRLSRRVSAADRRTVDEYLESIRDIERRLKIGKRRRRDAGGDALVETLLQRPESGIPEDHDAYMRQMMDLIVLAFWSDSTRVCTFMMDHGQSNRYFNFIPGVSGTWHALSHWKSINGKTEDDDGKTSWSSREEKLRMYNEVTRWHTRQVAYLLNRLAAVGEQGVSLLDQSMVVYGSSLADGHEHEARNLPVLLAGGGGGTIRGGRLHRAESGNELSMSSLHLALLQRLGVRCDEFAESRRPIELS